MAKMKIRMGLLLLLLVVVIVGFVYALYYAQEDDTKEGTLVEYRLPELESHSREVAL